ncbi:alpha-N-acetylgalactosaminide alpha-2,6-sialyltransferase 2-like isoform X1 [Arapaima gigas]
MGFLKRVVLFALVVLVGLYFIYSPLSLNLQPLVSRWNGAKTAAPLLKAEASLPTGDCVTTAVPSTVAPPATTSPQAPHRPSTTATRKTTKAPRTTESSYIGDRYTMDDMPPQTSCADGIRQKVKQTDFGKRFLEHVPVLQWQKHGTLEEYERLRQYPGAHGWGGVDYDTLMETLSILNTTANRLMFDDWERRANGSSCIRCAVVGNGGILQGSKMGQEIDQHDYIFRTNGAVILGFEEDVGSRTTMYTFSTNTLRNSFYNYAAVGYKGPPLSEETRYLFLPDHDRDYLLLRAAATHTPVRKGPESNGLPPRFFGDEVTVEKFKIYHPDFIRYIRNRFLRSSNLKSKYRDIYRPSTGAVMLLAALHTCDQVSAYGFMTPDYQKYSDHYYDKSYHKVAFYVNHDLRMELVLWQKLHQAGLIHLYMHQ